MCNGAVVFLRSSTKLAIGVLIVGVGLTINAFAPPQWFNSIHQDDGSAMGRLYMWHVGLQIAEAHPFVGAGFKATAYPNMVNPWLHGIPQIRSSGDMHGIYINALSEHGWIGLALFLTVAGCSWINCFLLIKKSRGRPGLAWANLLGKMGQAALVGYWAGGAFLSQTYLDEYWCVISLLDAARRVVAREIAEIAGVSAATPSMRLRTSQAGIGPLALPKPDIRPG